MKGKSDITNFAIICMFCGEQLNQENDHNHEGVWCDDCDGFTFFDENRRNQFTLLLEDNQSKTETKSIQEIKFNQRLSPLRYPGGKSKIISTIFDFIKNKEIETFVEPFSGGASVGLSLLEAGVIKNLILNDLDFGIYSLFKTILEDEQWLIAQIQTMDLNHDDFYRCRTIVKGKYKDCSQREAALAMLITNRLAYSGICKANSMGGKNGTREALLSRWNPKELIKRILIINSMKKQILVKNQNATELIEEYYWHSNTAILIDPPYFLKGEQLYNHFYLVNEHQMLSELLDSLYQGTPGAELIVTYDEHEFIRKIYKYPNIKILNRNYSI